LRSEDPNQLLKDFLKLVDSLDIDGSITTWEDLTTRFLAQFFPPRRTVKLRNDILMFQQHHGESLSEAWTRFKDLLQKYCMENPEQAFVDYASSRTDEARENGGELMFIEIIRDDDEPQNGSLNEGEGATTEGPIVEYLDTFPTRDELTYHKENVKGGISNFTRKVKGMHVFVGNFTYVVDFMIIEDITSIIDPRLSQVVLGRPFIEVSNMTHDLPEGVIRFTNKNDEVDYKPPHKLEQYNSLSKPEKKHKSSLP
nr:zinc finger, CCHC-type [Tanacetum cinerariifolium]